ncbi:MAG: acyl-CoA dehydrogenase family protein [Planctomycetota bacterium]|jgi:alkylation response protein AidB-like acyl-CoA dehydrogenase
MTAPGTQFRDAYDPVDYAARYALAPEDEAWRQRARAFAAEHIRPIARQADRARNFARDLVALLGRDGLLGATLRAGEGGGGASTLAGCLIAEEIGAVDGSVRGFLAVQVGLVAHALEAFGTRAQKDAWLPPLLAGDAIGCYALTEEGAGSDVGAIATRARRDGEEVVLDGEKIWITNGGVAQVALVFATANPDAKHRGIECFLVPTDTKGWSTSAMPGRELGHRASNHACIRLEGVRVPLANRLGTEGGGYRVAMTALEYGRLNVAAGGVGIQRACLEACLAFGRRRRQFGRRVGDFQQVSATLADMATRLEASRLLTHQAARLRDRGLESVGATSAAKLYASEGALRTAKDALQIHGARAYTDELPIERHYRDAVALTIYEGTSHIQRLILSRRLLGRDSDRGS